MNEHLTHGQLNDLMEGLLSGVELERARGHVEACPACRTELNRLEELLSSLGALPDEATPSRDLWPEIEGRLEDPGADVVPFPDAGARKPSGLNRRVSMSVGQLLAAGIVLASLSGSAAWLALSGSPQAPEGGAALSSLPAIRTAARGAIADYESAAADLEEVIREGRNVLKPETLEVLDENLHTIDRAIAEARGALDRDPGSEVLYRLLAKNMRRKLDLLRSAAQAISAAS